MDVVNRNNAKKEMKHRGETQIGTTTPKNMDQVKIRRPEVSIGVAKVQFQNLVAV